LSNNTNPGAHAKTRKAELQNARRAAMSLLLVLHYISYMVMEQFVGGQGTSNKENKNPNGNGDWLHRNNSYQPHYVDVENISTQIPGVVYSTCYWPT